MVTPNVSRIDRKVAEHLMASWIRKATATQPDMADDVYSASSAVADESQLAQLTQPIAFALGTEFGARVAMAVLANPLDAERDVREVVEATQAALAEDSQRERLEGELFAARGNGAS